MTEYGASDDHQVKHLETIQAVVARLGNNAFLIKGWAITVTGAFVAFAVDRDQWELASASVVPTLLFWMFTTHSNRVRFVERPASGLIEETQSATRRCVQE